jgi:hypothetical protein
MLLLYLELIQLSPGEIYVIEHGFENPNDIRAPNAIFPLMDIPFKAVRADKFSIYAKHEKNGVIIARTNHHYVLGTYDSSMYASVAVESVEKLGIVFSFS